MKLYECYENEYLTYYIIAKDTEQAYDVLKKELRREDKDEEDADNFAIDLISTNKPRVLSINSLD